MRHAMILVVMFALLSTVPILAQVPRIMNYQGKLTNASGVALDGSHNITFYILKNYDPSTDAADDTLWGETLSVLITNGLFDITLGDVHPINLDFSVPYYMELVVDGETLSPREKLAPVSFAFRSIYADTADYVEGGAGDNDWVISGDGTAPDTVYNLDDYVGIGTASPDASALLDLTSTSKGLLIPRMTTTQRDAIDLTGSPNSVIIFNTTTTCFEFYYNGSWYNIACTCTPPDVPVATAATTGITASQFTANWNAATEANGYYLDVSEYSDFSSFVSGYENLDVGDVTSYDVTGLSAGTTYYYRVRAYNDCATSGNSNVILVTTSIPLSPRCVTIGGTSWDEGQSIIQTSDGGYAIAGRTQSFGEGSSDVYVVKLDGSGNLSWTGTIGGTSYDKGYSIIQTSDGGYAIAGCTQSFGEGSSDVYVVKLDASGNLSWTKTIGGTDADDGYSIIQTSDGGYAIAGCTQSFGEGYLDVYVIKLDASGNLSWTRTIGGTNSDYGYSIIQTSDGGYAIAGCTGSYGAGAGYLDVYVIKLDASGSLSWKRTIGGTNHDEGYSIIQTSDGGYAVAGYTQSFGEGSTDVYVIKLNSSGDVSWTKTIGDTDYEYGRDIIQTSDGGYAVAGYTHSYGAGNDDVYVIKLDGSGNLSWTRTIGGANDDKGYSIIQTSDGNYAIAGCTGSYGAGSFDLYFIALDSDGTVCTPNCGSGEGGILNSPTSSTGGGGTLGSPTSSTSSPSSSTGSGGTITTHCP